MKQILLLFAFVSISNATTYYVRKTGNDSNNCTNSTTQACLTINRGRNVATAAGDIVDIGAGTYSERLTLTTGGSSGGGKITFRGHDGSGCPTSSVSDGNHPTGTRPNPSVIMGGFNVAADYIAIDCFKVTSAQTSSDAMEIDTDGINDVDFTHIYIDGNYVIGTAFFITQNNTTMASNIYVGYSYVAQTGYGTLVGCGGNCTFEYTEIEDLGGTGTDMDYNRVFGDNITYRANYFHGNDLANCLSTDCHVDGWQSFNIGGFGGGARNVLLERNVVMNAHECLIATNTTATEGAQDNWTFRNNICSEGPVGSDMIWCAIFDGQGFDAVMYNNTCIGSVTVVRDSWGTGGATLIYKNNIHYASGFNPYFEETGGSITTTNKNLIYESGRTYLQADFPNTIVNQNPLFVNVATFDYHLQSSSPAKDAGETLASVTNDLDGNSRPQGAGYDIGAFEITSGASSPTVTTSAVSSISTTTATGNGNVTSDGGDTVTARGVCVGTSPSPTSTCFAAAAGGTGTYTASMTGLSPNTFYYVAAYATNGVGTSYGSDVTFTTSALTNPTASMSGKASIGGKASIH